MSEHDVPMGLDASVPDRRVIRMDLSAVPDSRKDAVMDELRACLTGGDLSALTACAARHGVTLSADVVLGPPPAYSAADAYHSDAIRTRSTTYRPDLLSLNWLEHTLSNAAQLGRDARRLKKAAFGGVEDPDRPGGSKGFAHPSQCDPTRVSPHILHSMLGLINEVGEMAEMIHAVLSGKKPFDAINWIEEKGDAAWFLFCDCDETGLTVSEIMRRNIAKLRARFPHKFEAAKLDDAGRDKAAETAALTGTIVLDSLGGIPAEDDPAEHAS